MKKANDVSDHKLNRLTEEWKYAKQMEQHWNASRIAVESQIYELIASELPDKGTFTTETGMKITTGFSEDWDAESINSAYQQWPEGVKFPFNGTWKPDGKAISYLRDNQPLLYALLQPALTLKPKKPAFSVKGE